MTATMAKFRYEGENLDGEAVKGTVEAQSESAARNQLAVDGTRVTKISEKKKFSEIEISKARVPMVEIMQFSRQMATFAKAGVPLLDALENIRADASNKRFKAVLTEAIEKISAGSSISQAIAGNLDVFPSYYPAILSSAELTGRMDIAFRQLHVYIKRDLDLVRQVRKALIYPAILLVVAFGVVLAIVIFAIPRFAAFFKDFNAELPLPTRMLMAISDFVGSTAGAITGAVLAVLIIGFLAWSKTPKGKRRVHGAQLRIPAIGPVIRHSAIERFSRILSVLLEAGVPMPEALPVAIDSANNLAFKEKLNTATESILAGQGFAEPLKSTGLFPATTIQMVRVGESTGELPEQLDNVASFYQDELSYSVDKLTQWFEPLIILFIGGVVGFVALAMVSAMYGVYGQVQGG